MWVGLIFFFVSSHWKALYTEWLGDRSPLKKIETEPDMVQPGLLMEEKSAEEESSEVGTDLLMRQTLLGALFPGLYAGSMWKRCSLLFVEALGCCLLGIYLPIMMGFDESILISMFLVSVPLSQRLAVLLEENRHNIWVKQMAGWDVNRNTGLCLLCMFLGVLGGYLAAVLVSSSSIQMVTSFDFALEAANAKQGTILTRNFSGFLPIFGHNLSVLLVLSFLCFVYRSYGAMLGLVWNACVWVAVLTVLTQRAMIVSEMPSWQFGLIAFCAVIPHLLIEGIAYIFGSMAGIFFSQGLMRYDLSEGRFMKVLKACPGLLVVAVTLIFLGAATEAKFATFMLEFLK